MSKTVATVHSIWNLCVHVHSHFNSWFRSVYKLRLRQISASRNIANLQYHTLFTAHLILIEIRCTFKLDWNSFFDTMYRRQNKTILYKKTLPKLSWASREREKGRKEMRNKFGLSNFENAHTHTAITAPKTSATPFR